MSYKSRIDTLRLQMNEMLKNYSDNWEFKDDFRRCAIEIALLQEAIANGSTEPETSFEEKANVFLKTGVVESYFTKKSKAMWLREYIGGKNPAKVSKKAAETRAKEEQNLLGWIKEYREKQQYFDEYDNLPTEVKNSYDEAHKTSPYNNMSAREVYAETAHAEATFDKLNEQRGDDKYVGEEEERLKQEFVELWHVNQTFKECDYNGALSSEKLFETATTKGIDQKLLEEYSALADQTDKNRKKYPPVDTSIMEKVSRYLSHSYDFSGTPQAEQHNQEIRNDLLSGDPKRQKAARAKVVFEVVNKLLAIPNSAFVPKNDKEFVETYKKYGSNMEIAWIADTMNNASLAEFDLPKEVIDAVKYKHDLFSAYYSEYKSKFDAFHQFGLKDNRLKLLDNLTMAGEDRNLFSTNNHRKLSLKETEGIAKASTALAVRATVEKVEFVPDKHAGVTLTKEKFKIIDMFAVNEKAAQDAIASKMANFAKGAEINNKVFKKNVAQVALHHKASVNSENKTTAQVNVEAMNFSKSDYFDIYLGSRTLLELGEIYQGANNPAKAAEFNKELNKFYSVYNDYLEKAPFIEQYDKLPKAQKNEILNSIGTDVAVPKTVAKFKYVENAHAEAKFEEIWARGGGDAELILDQDQKAQNKAEFKSLWQVNQRIREINPSKALSYDALFELTVKDLPADADSKLSEMMKGLSNNELTKLQGQSTYYPFSKETKDAISAVANDILSRRVIGEYIKGTDFAKGNTVHYYNNDNQEISEYEADALLYNGEKVVAKAFKNGKSMGLGTVIGYNEKGQLTKTKPERAIGDMRLLERSNSLENHAKILGTLEKALTDTNSIFVSSSPEYSTFMKNLNKVVAAHKDLGENINPKQAAEIEKLYSDLGKSCKAYLDVKAGKLTQVRNNNKYDERGELRYAILQNLSTILSPKHLTTVLANYKGYSEYQKSTKDVEGINSLLDKAIGKTEGVYGNNPGEKENIEKIAKFSREAVEKYRTLGEGDTFAKALIGAKMKTLYTKVNNLNRALNIMASNPVPFYDPNMDKLSENEIQQLKDIVTDCEQAQKNFEKQPGIRYYGNKVKNLAVAKSADNKIEPSKQLEALKKVKEILDKSEKGTIKSSNQFANLQKTLTKTIRTQALMGTEPNPQQIAALKDVYKDLEKAANAYIEYKDKDLKATFDKNKRDPRGELRFNTVSSLKSIIKPEQVEAVCNSYAGQAIQNNKKNEEPVKEAVNNVKQV